MKKFLIICLLAIVSQAHAAFPLSGRQYDYFITKSEYQVVQTIYFKWTRSWGGIPKVETASTMLYMMLDAGKGLRLTSSELAAIKSIDSQVVNRANIVLQSIKSKISKI